MDDEYHDDFPDSDDDDDDDMPPSTTNNRRLAPLPFSPKKKAFKMENEREGKGAMIAKECTYKLKLFMNNTFAARHKKYKWWKSRSLFHLNIERLDYFSLLDHMTNLLEENVKKNLIFGKPRSY
ncbi:Tetratricopeptide repeat protein 39B [Frankliniella fusca]|uniref:Tetratricopeptide repeat protein 39B n=1 Tax=Frankliniella fusca TaxID=407009 RepID=A0AAE1L8U2_9NEOP|nr:Tetratricopeptide repeat protein 39B [Frankliniella fusca]